VMGGGGGMQGRVARVDVVTNRDKEVGAGILAGRSGPKRVGGQARCLIEHSRDPDVVTGGDRSEERKQRTVVELAGSATCLRHEYRLPDLERGRSGAGPPHIGGCLRARLRPAPFTDCDSIPSPAPRGSPESAGRGRLPSLAGWPPSSRFWLGSGIVSPSSMCARVWGRLGLFT